MQILDHYNRQLVTKNTISDIEKKYISENKTSKYELMKIAGKAFANYISRNYKKTNILFLCGKGGNGGDGLIAARILKEKGWKISIVIGDSKEDLSKDTNKAFKKLKLIPKNFEKLNISDFGLIIDALFGVGLSRNVSGEKKTIISKVNSYNVPVVAIDIPSGINSDTGKIMGIATNCKNTVTFSRAKIGNILLPGHENNGNIVIANIGIPNSYFYNLNPKINSNHFNIWKKHIISPRIDDNKYSRGYTLVIGGPKTMTGAARLAAKAAQRVGSGIVTVAVPKNSEDIYFSALTTQIVKSYRNLSELKIILSDSRIDSIVVGPGLGKGIKTINIMKVIFKKKRKAVIDADAISSFENNLDLLLNITSGSEVIYTPHEGELLKLFPNISGTVIDKSLYAGKKLKSAFLLKGPNTVVSKNNSVLINSPGSKWLSTAGSGDVLAGIIGALMAKGIDTFSAAGLGVFIHTEAGKIGGPGLISEDLIDLLPQILKKFL